VASKLGWYVYLLVDPRSGRPFYVGRGRGNRCFRHVGAARAAREGPAEPGAPTGRSRPDARSEEDPGRPDAQGREFPLLGRINEIEAAAGPVRVEILRYGLDSDEARLVEVAAHDALGLRLGPKLASQRQPAAELGVRLAKRAKFKRDHQVVLLQVAGRGTDTTYEHVRHGWRIGKRWTDPHSPRSPRWAVIVAGQMVVATYRIEAWEPTPVPGRPDRDGSTTAATARAAARSSSRYSFIGVPDDELDRRYGGRSVAPYLDAGPLGGLAASTAEGAVGPAGVSAPAMGPPKVEEPGTWPGVGPVSQVTYVWCGPRWEAAPG